MDEDSLTKALFIARAWSPPVTIEDKLCIMGILTGTEPTVGRPLLRKYIDLLRPYTDILGISGKGDQPREADCVASGIVFFYGCLFYIMHFPGWGAHIEDIFLYNLLYILVDHYIDDIRIQPELKNQTIAQMFTLIHNPLAEIPLLDPILKTIAIVYYRLITRCPDTKPAILDLFLAEIEGLSIQKSATLSREQYYNIALRKGGYTMKVLQRIVGNSDPTLDAAAYKLGEIVQFLDDLLDVVTDMKNGIHTIATHDLRTRGNLDELWIDTMHKINAIDPRFTVFKILHTFFAVYIPGRNPISFSEELRLSVNSLNLFECNASSMLVEAIMSELAAIEVLES